ncbi:hypothetical protein BBJ28_00021870 [Nothophytophthora sp. Chile5]|nr:hypothetical protein BBJ28_00021870 [Nothophytophthora sp. Chile5]
MAPRDSEGAIPTDPDVAPDAAPDGDGLASNVDQQEFDRAMEQEEQQELPVFAQVRATKYVELDKESAVELQCLVHALPEANERVSAGIEQQLAACKLVHEAETARLEEMLRAERARQEQELKERLAAKRQRREQQTGDVESTEPEDDSLVDERETMETQTQLEEQAMAYRESLVARQQQELAGVMRELEHKTAVDQCLVAEREHSLLEEKLNRERRALQQSLLADQQHREAQLHQKVQLEAAAEAVAERELTVLQEQFGQEQAAATAQEHEKQEARRR